MQYSKNVILLTTVVVKMYDNIMHNIIVIYSTPSKVFLLVQIPEYAMCANLVGVEKIRKSYLRKYILLLWRHVRVTVSSVTGKCYLQQLFRGNENNIKDPLWWVPLYIHNIQWQVDWPGEVSVMRRVFQCHDDIMQEDAASTANTNPAGWEPTEAGFKANGMCHYNWSMRMSPP